MMIKFLKHIVVLIIFVGCNPKSQNENASLGSKNREISNETRLSDHTNKSHQQTFIPIYSAVNFKKNRKYKLAVTLRIRNLDATQSVMIRKIKIVNDGGEVSGLLAEKDVNLRPFQAINIFVEEIKETESGFLVEWEGDSLTNLPIMQSVMLGTTDTQGISFVVEGIHLKE